MKKKTNDLSLIEKVCVCIPIIAIIAIIAYGGAWVLRWVVGQFWHEAFNYSVWLWWALWFVIVSLLKAGNSGKDK
jgi:hypothetical protein